MSLSVRVCMVYGSPMYDHPEDHMHCFHIFGMSFCKGPCDRLRPLPSPPAQKQERVLQLQEVVEKHKYHIQKVEVSVNLEL